MFETREQAVQFFMHGHHDSTGREVLRPMVDMRQLGCPARIFDRIVEHRAQKLGVTATEFRTLMKISDTLAPVVPGSLSDIIASNRLF